MELSLSNNSLPGANRSPEQLKLPFIVDGYLLAVTILLLGLGLVMIYSTTGVVSQEKLGDAMYYLKRQAVAAIIGLVVLVVGAAVNDFERIKRMSPWFFFVALALLVLTAMPGIGDNAGGARRWIKAGPIRFQPGEFVKLLFVVFFAGFLNRHQAKLSTFIQGVVIPLVLIGMVAGLFLIQPDFGSASVVTIVCLIMAGVSGVRLRYLVFAGLFVACCMTLLVLISPYRMSRVMSFMSPDHDASGKGYQLIQSLIAVGTGKLQGVGLGASQQKLFFLPAAHTDFIFAVIAEELGFIGCAGLIGLFLIFFMRGVMLAEKLADDTFLFSLTVGLTMLVVVPAFLNIGVVTGLLPTKGMVLPLVGYGGSSLIASMFQVGLLLGLARHHYRRR